MQGPLYLHCCFSSPAVFTPAVCLCISVCPGDWEHWLNRVEQYIYPSDSVPEFSTILVPNVDNVRTSFLMDTIAKQHKVH